MAVPNLYLDRLVTSLRQQGAKRTMLALTNYMVDWSFDIRYGTDTMRWESLDRFAISSRNVQSGNRYQATKARHLWKLLNTMRFPPGSVFVDMGSGKGRVLMIASGYPFKRVVGIEFSHELCLIAEANLEKYRRHIPKGAPISVVERDAAEYTIRPDENVFFFYNPFHEDVFSRVLENIRTSIEMHPRQVWIIYHAPVYRDLVERTGYFKKSIELDFAEAEFSVYSNMTEIPQSKAMQ